MIVLREIKIYGESSEGPFEGQLLLNPRVNIISAKNAYGKSLFFKAVSWCLGLEPMHGLKDNDASLFPYAVKDTISLNGDSDIPVLSSTASVLFERDDGASIRIHRHIHGEPTSEVRVDEIDTHGKTKKSSRMLARKRTLKDQSGGLQSFLFSWIDLPLAEVMTNLGRESPIYLENIAPLFLIDQNEGWGDIQSLQVFRYAQQEIKQASFEYLLGALESLKKRYDRQKVIAMEARLKDDASVISEKVSHFSIKKGYPIDLSSHGSIDSIIKRWTKTNLAEIFRNRYNLDLPEEHQTLAGRAKALRKKLLLDAGDPMDITASSEASQKVIELKSRRHEARSRLRTENTQLTEQLQLLKSIENRIQSSEDMLRLKQLGIGRFEIVECPTCHRHLEPDTFHLTEQSKLSVTTHIESLKRDRALISSNVHELKITIAHTTSQLEEFEEELKDAQRALATVNATGDIIREQIGKIAADLAATERKIDRNNNFSQELKDLQEDISEWIERAKTHREIAEVDTQLKERLDIFLEYFRANLLSLGHSEITESNKKNVLLDDMYVPYIGSRRLRSTGSASDYSRLIAAYVIALAEARIKLKSPHPGLVLLDEPLQQNPDSDHRGKLVKFLQGLTNSPASLQLTVFTHLSSEEIKQIKDHGVDVVILEGDHIITRAKSLGGETEQGLPEEFDPE